ncbi:type I methionyl aminopeptidase [Polyangium mundeleinium]|uniref:Methionine aminopeptidase n=1 Tax=Polyangium mundeleinium TaxID=2995306 RepID=A0ABT5EP63_9BACT|nr:type I methionyl aminopeptidase [Polyangium mundeleinium]MDC0743633.1 type I methionyl aminopeptidase [Polyangium mundeleinium]
MSNVSIKTLKEVEGMRAACQMAAETLLDVGEMLRPGITTEDINRFVHDDTVRRGGWPAPLNYHGFPKSVCTSVNEVVCHGIPGARVLEPGDIINVDVTTIYNGFYGDTSATFYVGKPSSAAKHVTEVSRRSLDLAIAQVREGARLGDIGAAIQEFAEGEGCSVVRAFVGHGIGRVFHEAPQVSHVGKRGTGMRLRAGMCFTIEPMINLGHHDVEVLADKWTAVTADGSLSAQFEHTLVVTKNGCEVLTRRSRQLSNSEIFGDVFSVAAAATTR